MIHSSLVRFNEASVFKIYINIGAQSDEQTYVKSWIKCVLQYKM